MGVQFWWFYDVIVVAAILVCVFITIKKGIMKAAVAFVGYALSIAIAFSFSTSITDSIYSKTVRESNIKKINQTLSEGDFLDDLIKYIENLGYNVSVDRRQLESICFEGTEIDTKLYKYLNNINGRKVDEESAFLSKLHEGYASLVNTLVSKQLSLYSAEYATEKVRTNPKEFVHFLPLLQDPDNTKPAAQFIVDTYLEAPYISQIKLTVMIVLLIFFVLMTIFIETAAGRNSHMEPSFVAHSISGIIGLFKGFVIIVMVAVMIRLYVVLGSNKMLFFNHEAIDKTYIFKYFYNFIKDM
ncbi:hypothetical protein [Ruminococcus flavefaciens]|uniref:Colicin V production protein n=1 Tax=Ruminococcus flavefaciens TaxID=1265 RepID=A0A1M7GME6_RUMFL|nr:hypothetical protein [Ruminococcus flavefaciens]SHM17335.1 hypothetical protein SAMN04487860_101384 [Ruminococcus flavefaciens]